MIDYQGELLKLPEAAARASVEGRPGASLPRKWRHVDRAQMMMANIYVEELIAVDHQARAIWELAGRLDLGRFAEAVKTLAGGSGHL